MAGKKAGGILLKKALGVGQVPANRRAKEDTPREGETISPTGLRITRAQARDGAVMRLPLPHINGAKRGFVRITSRCDDRDEAPPQGDGKFAPGRSPAQGGCLY